MSAARWRKFSPIDQDFPIFELVDRDRIILDVSKDVDGNLKIAFHEGALGQLLDLKTFEQLLTEVKALLADEEPDAGKGNS